MLQLKQPELAKLGEDLIVFAEEVPKLAEESSRATKQISCLISEVQAKTDSTVCLMKESKKEVNIGTFVMLIEKLWTDRSRVGDLSSY